MARRARGYRSAPPMVRFTPGIVDHGEVMRITRRTFIAPDETPLPQGKRTMVVGRKVYSWSTAADTSKPRDGRYTDHLSEDDQVNRRQVRMLDYVEPSPSAVSEDDRRKWGLPSPVAVSYSAVTVDDNLRAIPSKPPQDKPARAAKVGSIPRQKSADPGPTRDDAVRAYLSRKGVSHAVTDITPAIRAAALEAIESERQLAEYVA